MSFAWALQKPTTSSSSRGMKPAYTIFAQAEDRTGFTCGTLTPRPGLSAAVPPMDPRPKRTTMDMGMSMGSMKGMSDMKGMDMPGMSGMESMKGMDMLGMQMGGKTTTDAGPDHEMHQSMQVTGESKAAMAISGTVGMTPFPQPGPNTTPMASMSGGMVKMQSSDPIKLHLGPQVVAMPKMLVSRINEPGDGLGHNRRRVLTYADLRARYRGVDPRPSSREIELHLNGQYGALHLGIRREEVFRREADRAHTRRTGSHRAGQRYHDGTPDSSPRIVERTREWARCVQSL